MTFKPEDIRQDKELTMLRDKVNQLETDLGILTTRIETILSVSRYVLGMVGLSLGIDILPMMEGM